MVSNINKPIMKGISELAEHDQILKAAVSKAIKRLISDFPDTIIERDSRDRIKRIKVAAALVSLSRNIWIVFASGTL